MRVNTGQKTLEATDGSGRKSEISSVAVAKDQQYKRKRAQEGKSRPSQCSSRSRFAASASSL